MLLIGKHFSEQLERNESVRNQYGKIDREKMSDAPAMCPVRSGHLNVLLVFDRIRT